MLEKSPIRAQNRAMETAKMRTYPVMGGWHAEDLRFLITCFGTSKDEAIRKLEIASHDAATYLEKARAERAGGRNEEN